MAEPGPDDVVIPALVGVILSALDDYAETRSFTIGQAMAAMFSLMVQSAKRSPEYDPKKLVEDVSARIREATGLQ